MQISRRTMLSGLGGATLLAACGNGVNSSGAQQIDARVDATKAFLDGRYPGTVELTNKAYGVLYMPLMTEAGFFVGGAYGRGALRINGATVDYYSATEASYGPQIGVQQYGHALFFMTEEALANFRSSRRLGRRGGHPLCHARPGRVDRGRHHPVRPGDRAGLRAAGADGRRLDCRDQIHPHHPLIRRRGAGAGRGASELGRFARSL